EPLREAIAPRLQQEREHLSGHLHPHLEQLQHLLHQVHKQEEEEEKRLRELERKMAAALEPFERALAWHRLQQGADLDALAKELKDKKKKEDVEKNLQRVLSYLDPQLATGEHSRQARELLKKGEEVAEVVAHLVNALSPARGAV